MTQHCVSIISNHRSTRQRNVIVLSVHYPVLAVIMGAHGEIHHSHLNMETRVPLHCCFKPIASSLTLPLFNLSNEILQKRCKPQ